MQAHGQVLGLAALHHIFQVDIALPVLGILAIGAVPVAVAATVGVDLGQVGLAADVGHGGRQAGHAEAGKVVGVLELPGALIGPVEIRVLLGVVQVHAVALGDVIERRVAIDPLISRCDAVVTHAHGEMQAVGVVVDIPQQRLTGVLGMVVVQAGRQADQVVQGVGVFQVVVILVPDVLEFGCVQVAGQPLDPAERHASPVQVLAVGVGGQRAVAGTNAPMAALVIELGETGLATFDHPAVKAVVGQAHATESLRQHACHAAGDHRVVEEQVAGFQFGVEGAQLQGAASRRERTRRFAVAAAIRKDAGTIRTTTAVELEAEHGIDVQAEADGALGVAGFEGADKALAPFLAVIGMNIASVAVHVVVAGVDREV